jgi:hypothetical protein
MPKAEVRTDFSFTKGEPVDIAPSTNFQGTYVLRKGGPAPGAPHGRYTVIAYVDKDAPKVSLVFDFANEKNAAIVVDVEARAEESDCQHALTTWNNAGGGGGGGGMPPPVWTGRP